MDFLSGYVDSMPIVDKGAATLTIPFEVLLALATAGLGAAVAGSGAVRHAGQFTGKAIELMVGLSRALTKVKLDKKAGQKKVAKSSSLKSKNNNPDKKKYEKNVIARTAAQDRDEITRLSKEAADAKKSGDKKLYDQKINQARDILRPHLPKGPNDSWDAVVERLDVSSPKDGAVFWSGDLDTAMNYAERNGGVTLESTPGGRVLDGWDELNKGYAWNKSNGKPPYTRDLWKQVSKKYSSSAKGKVNVIQTDNKLWDQGTLWHNAEKKILKNSMLEGSVKNIDIHVINSSKETIKLSENYINSLLKLKGMNP